MDIKQLAKDMIDALNLVPKEQVRIDVVSPDWSGSPEIRVVSDPTKPDIETQFGTFSETTILGIHVFADTREQAVKLHKPVDTAVYDKFEELERQRGSGILCIVRLERGSVQIPNSTAYQAYTSFRITVNA